MEKNDKENAKKVDFRLAADGAPEVQFVKRRPSAETRLPNVATCWALYRHVDRTPNWF